MKRLMNLISLLSIIFLTSLQTVICQTISKEINISLQIDASKKLNMIDGFGVNANTRSWNDDDLKPAIDLLVQKMNARLWRVIIETQWDWEVENDNKDPLNYNWEYYNKLYATPKFVKALDMIAYLNNIGITEGLVLNFMGWAPVWMGGLVVKPEFEEEYVEMLASFIIYARKEKNLQFELVAPYNEPDIKNEGPSLTGMQCFTMFKRLIARMESAGLGDIRYVVPDCAGSKRSMKEYVPLIMSDPRVMKKVAHIGYHSYNGYSAPLDSFMKHSPYPETSYWMTEWNAWCDGCDNGKLGVYSYEYAKKAINFLFDLLDHNTTGTMVWEGFDSYYEHHSANSYWGILGYDEKTKTYFPRKHFYAHQQISRFINPGSWRIQVEGSATNIKVQAFHDPASGRITIAGINNHDNPLNITANLAGLQGLTKLEMYCTGEKEDFKKHNNIVGSNNSFNALIPANSIYTITGIVKDENKVKRDQAVPEPAGWYAGDMHVHRNCGGDHVVPDEFLKSMMEEHNLAVISMMADMGNAEVKYAGLDLPKVNGKDAPESEPGRIIRWDAEWHWDATYGQFDHQALGGHLILLGLNNVQQIWDESPYKILEWGKQQNAVQGFAHMQYLNDEIQSKLNCCIPIDYPVEAALKTIDFISEDVNGSDPAIHAYYKLLNCGFRLGLAGGTDFPCNNNEPLGTVLTYVQVKNQPLTYEKWIQGIKNGRTVVARNGHSEFLEFKANGTSEPGDEIKLKKKGTVSLDVSWTSLKEQTGNVEIVCNGKVVSSRNANTAPGKPFVLSSNLEITQSSWVCARRMNYQGHVVHTAPIYITVKNKPVRASAEDAQFFIKWIDNMLEKTSPGGDWNHFFSHDLEVVQGRYKQARDIYIRVMKEAQAGK